MTVMVSVLLKALMSILMRLFAVAASEELLEYGLKKLARAIAESSETTHDEEFVEKIIGEYESVKDGERKG